MAPAKLTCHYKFPLHPADMVERSPADLSPFARQLRMQMIAQIAQLSARLSQRALDEKVFIDVEEGEIVGMDCSELVPGAPNMCVGDARVPLGRLSAAHWITMRYAAA